MTTTQQPVQALTVRDTRTAHGHTIEVTRDDKGDITRGYIVTTHNERMITTVATIPVGDKWSQSVAYAIALNTARLLADTMTDNGPTLNFHPRNNRYY